jgi:hypothetical protein
VFEEGEMISPKPAASYFEAHDGHLVPYLAEQQARCSVGDQTERKPLADAIRERLLKWTYAI